MSIDLFTDALDRLLADACTPARVRGIEAGASVATLWEALRDSGFADALVPEGAGGGGLTFEDAAPLFALCGRHALPLPLVTTMVVRAVCGAEGVTAPDGPVTLASQVRLDGEALVCERVPLALASEHVLVPLGDGAVLLPVAAAECVATGVHGSLAAEVRWSRRPAGAPVLRTRADWRAVGAGITAQLMAGAMAHVLDTTLRYANDRVQFGKPIAKFQAIQQQLAVMAEEVFAARTAARIGAAGGMALPDSMRAAVAKARTGEAAVRVAAIAHAVHGAIGVTAEYDLQLLTRRLHEWRGDHGTETHWQRRIGAALLDDPRAEALAFVTAIGGPAR